MIDRFGNHADSPGLRERLEREQLVLVQDALGEIDPPPDEPFTAVNLVHTHGVGDEFGPIVDTHEHSGLM